MNSSENPLDIKIDDLFKDLEESRLPENSSNPEETKAKSKEDLTKAVSERINTVRKSTEKETRDNVAKELGYADYDSMKKAQEKKLVEEHGLNPEDVEKVVAPLVKKRLEEDPRFQKLAELERREKDNYIKEQLAAINATTGQNLKPSDLDKETLDLWGKGIELEQAYYATKGKTILNGKVAEINKGSLNHLAPGSSGGQVKTRTLTHEEKEMWRAIVPGITEEELSKKTTIVDTK